MVLAVSHDNLCRVCCVNVNASPLLLGRSGSKGLWHAKDAEIEKLVHRLLRWLGDDASLMDDSLQSFSDLLTAHSTSLSPSLLPLLHATLTDRYMQLEVREFLHEGINVLH